MFDTRSLKEIHKKDPVVDGNGIINLFYACQLCREI